MWSILYKSCLLLMLSCRFRLYRVNTDLCIDCGSCFKLLVGCKGWTCFALYLYNCHHNYYNMESLQFWSQTYCTHLSMYRPTWHKSWALISQTNWVLSLFYNHFIKMGGQDSITENLYLDIRYNVIRGV